VSGQFLNGTSAHIRLFSAIHSFSAIHGMVDLHKSWMQFPHDWFSTLIPLYTQTCSWFCVLRAVSTGEQSTGGKSTNTSSNGDQQAQTAAVLPAGVSSAAARSQRPAALKKSV